MYWCAECDRQVFCGKHVCRRGVPSVMDIVASLGDELAREVEIGKLEAALQDEPGEVP